MWCGLRGLTRQTIKIKTRENRQAVATEFCPAGQRWSTLGELIVAHFVGQSKVTDRKGNTLQLHDCLFLFVWIYYKKKYSNNSGETHYGCRQLFATKISGELPLENGAEIVIKRSFKPNASDKQSWPASGKKNRKPQEIQNGRNSPDPQFFDDFSLLCGVYSRLQGSKWPEGKTPGVRHFISNARY